MFLIMSSKFPRRPPAKDAILQAAVTLIRQHGYAATTVDQLCAAAGVTKGAFFHHFKSKDELGVAAAHHWSTTTGELFASAPYHEPAKAADRVLAYIRFRRELVQGDVSEFTCLVGTMVQEIHCDAPDIRDACKDSIFGHAHTLEADFDKAIAEAGLSGQLDAASLAQHTQAVLQGGFILAKAQNDKQPVLDSLDHLERYITCLFKNKDPD